MSRYVVEVIPQAERQIERIDKRDSQRVRDALASLADEPRPPGCTALRGAPGYRIRVGDYRIVYLIQDDKLVVVVVKVGHRREVYR